MLNESSFVSLQHPARHNRTDERNRSSESIHNYFIPAIEELYVNVFGQCETGAETGIALFGQGQSATSVSFQIGTDLVDKKQIRLEIFNRFNSLSFLNLIIITWV